jgi:hypothetical protein
VNKLGFRVTFEASEDGGSGLLGIERGAIQLTLDCPMQGHGRNACVALQVDDADAYYREWHAKVDVLRAPKDEEWGVREPLTCSTHPATQSSSWDRSVEQAKADQIGLQHAHRPRIAV